MSVTSLFQEVKTEVVADAEAAWAKIEQLYTQDAAPIIKATLMYVEQNGATDLLLIAKRVIMAEIDALLAGGNPIEALTALAGTVYDEAKSAGLAIEQGAALLVTSMVHAQATAAPPQVVADPAAGNSDASTGGATDSSSPTT